MTAMTTPTRCRARRIGGLIAVALAVLGASRPAGAAAEPTVALLPFENVSGSMQGQRLIMPLIEKALEERGYRLIEPARLEPFLFSRRIRRTGMLSREHLEALRRDLGADLAMVGSVALFNDAPDNPQWGLSSRLLATADGAIVWAESVGLTGDDFTIALGLGTITSGERLGREVVKALLRTLPEDPLRVPAREPAGKPLLPFLAYQPGYRSPTLDTAPPTRVAVLPFENLSERKGAGRIVTDVFVTALANQGRFQVIEPGTVAEALVALQAAPYGAITFDILAGLRASINADAVVLGTVFDYNEGIKRAATTSPEVALDARMLDTQSGRILWFAAHARSGDDSQIVLHFGVIRAMVPLVLKVTRQMVGSL